MEGVSCPDNINSVYCLLSGHETPATEFSNATEIPVRLRPGPPRKQGAIIKNFSSRDALIMTLRKFLLQSTHVEGLVHLYYLIIKMISII